MTSHFGGVGGGVGPGQDQRSQEEKGERIRTYTSVTDDRRKFYNDCLFICCLFVVSTPGPSPCCNHHGWLGAKPQLPVCPQGLIARVSSCTDSAPPTRHTVQHGSSTAAATRPPPSSTTSAASATSLPALPVFRRRRRHLTQRAASLASCHQGERQQ